MAVYPGTIASMPLTTVDIVIFSVRSAELLVLLVRRSNRAHDPFPGSWALPGGFVDPDRDSDLYNCALRKLRDETGIAAPYLEQLGSWGNATRDPRGWSATHVYFSLVAPEELDRVTANRTHDAFWCSVDSIGTSYPLAFDHEQLVRAAVGRLKNKVEYTSLPVYLMPEEFTLSELQQTYETILARTLEKKAFRTRVLSAGMLKRTAKKARRSNRPAQLFKVQKHGGPHLFARPFGSASPHKT